MRSFPKETGIWSMHPPDPSQTEPERRERSAGHLSAKDLLAFWLAYLQVFWPFMLIGAGVLIGVYLLFAWLF